MLVNAKRWLYLTVYILITFMNCKQFSLYSPFVFTVPPPTVSVGFSPPGAVPYAGNNLSLSCVSTLNGGITESDVMVTRWWTRNGAVFSVVPGRVTSNEQRPTTSVFIRAVVFSPLSSSMDNGTYACVVTLTPLRPQFVNTVNRSHSISLAVQGEIRIHAIP